VILVSKVRRYIFSFYFVSLLGRLEIYLTNACIVEGSGMDMSFVILGDNAFPLKTYLMKPFAR
jgi:hypothetical protein